MVHRADRLTLHHPRMRRIVLGAGLFLAFITLVTFLDVSAYLDRAASLKRSSRGPSVIGSVVPPPAVAPLHPVETAGPSTLPSPVATSPPAVAGVQDPAQSRRGNSAKTIPVPGQAMSSAYRAQREENFGR
jgi:hypothetical protein